uniref:Rab3-GAP regulatory subunit N-terminal domain-containing protein n=1 Tax=Glossina brevipalpis TaxID=37001 RepID=A0A1A9WKV4_9MUSC
MACEVKSFGNIIDFSKVQKYFGLGHDDNWLNAVHYSISPMGELIALAQGEKIALLSSCWDDKSPMVTYSLGWSGELDDPNEIITSVLCLPMLGYNVSSGAEWTCIVFGLSSGNVVFYTDTGIKIFSQSFHEGPVLNLKAYSPPRESEAEPFIYVTYEHCLCCIKGLDFIPHLNNLRHNLKRTLRRNNFSSLNAEATLKIADILTYQKLHFPLEHRTVINDSAVAAFNAPKIFDHCIDQCLNSGYYTRVTENPTQSSTVLGVGKGPYLGFYSAEEGYKIISLGEVAKDVIGVAYRNIFGNFFGRSPATTEDEDQSSLTGAKDIQMRSKFQFCDDKRDAYSVVIAPNGRLAAVVDNLERVMLVDCQRSIILRVWKGYRDAQCGFILVKEKTLKNVQTSRRKAMFLVIFAPRLGCLEIWPLQYGPKISAFTVSKNGQLIYNTHGLIGLNKDVRKIRAYNYTCLFLDPNDSCVKEIEIPFHYALSATNSATSRDIHLLRRLKNMLRSNDSLNLSTEELENFAAEFQTVEIRQQCLETLLKSKQLRASTFEIITNAFILTLKQQINNPADINDLDSYQDLYVTIENYRTLCDFYLSIKRCDKSGQLELFKFPDNYLVIIQQLVLLLSDVGSSDKFSSHTDGQITTGRSVKFDLEYDELGDFFDFVSLFQVNCKNNLTLRQEKSDNYGDVSGKLFSAFFNHGFSIENFERAAKKSMIPSQDLLILILHYWLEKPFSYKNTEEIIEDMSRLGAIIRVICEITGDVVNDYAYNAISPWWQKVRELLLQSTKSLGLLVAIVCKTVAKELRQDYKEVSLRKLL